MITILHDVSNGTHNDNSDINNDFINKLSDKIFFGVYDNIRNIVTSWD